MTIEIPGFLRHLDFLVGTEFPEGDEDAMWRLSSYWNEAAAQLEALVDDAGHARDTVRAAYSGDGADAIVARVEPFVSGPQSIFELAKVFRQLAAAANDGGTQIEYAKLMYITSLGILAAEIAFALTTVVGAGAVPGMIAATRVGLWSFLRLMAQRLAAAGYRTAAAQIFKFVGKEVSLEMFLGLAQEVGIQYWQVQDGHRAGIDTKQIVTATVSAGAGALLAAPVAATAGKFLSDGRGWNPHLGGLLAGAGAGAVGGAGGWVANGLMTDDWRWDWNTLTSGALGGAAPQGIKGAHSFGNGLAPWITDAFGIGPAGKATGALPSGAVPVDGSETSALRVAAAQPNGSADVVAAHADSQAAPAGTGPAPDAAATDNPAAAQELSTVSASERAGGDTSDAATGSDPALSHGGEHSRSATEGGHSGTAQPGAVHPGAPSVASHSPVAGTSGDTPHGPVAGTSGDTPHGPVAGMSETSGAGGQFGNPAAPPPSTPVATTTSPPPSAAVQGAAMPSSAGQGGSHDPATATVAGTAQGETPAARAGAGSTIGTIDAGTHVGFRDAPPAAVDDPAAPPAAADGPAAPPAAADGPAAPPAAADDPAAPITFLVAPDMSSGATHVDGLGLAFEGGAIRPRDPGFAFEWAEDAYRAFRDTDRDVEAIALNVAQYVRTDGSRFTAADIEQIKNHLMLEEHPVRDRDLPSGADPVLMTFDASPDIAEAWIRLVRGTALPQDFVLLEHELFESNYMRANPQVPYQDAHALANGHAAWERDVPGRTGERFDNLWRNDDGVAGVLRPDPGRPDGGRVPVRDIGDESGPASGHPEADPGDQRDRWFGGHHDADGRRQDLAPAQARERVAESGDGRLVGDDGYRWVDDGGWVLGDDGRYRWQATSGWRLVEPASPAPPAPDGRTRPVSNDIAREALTGDRGQRPIAWPAVDPDGPPPVSTQPADHRAGGYFGDRLTTDVVPGRSRIADRLAPASDGPTATRTPAVFGADTAPRAIDAPGDESTDAGTLVSGSVEPEESAEAATTAAAATDAVTDPPRSAGPSDATEDAARAADDEAPDEDDEPPNETVRSWPLRGTFRGIEMEFGAVLEVRGGWHVAADGSVQSDDRVRRAIVPLGVSTDGSKGRPPQAVKSAKEVPGTKADGKGTHLNEVEKAVQEDRAPAGNPFAGTAVAGTIAHTVQPDVMPHVIAASTQGDDGGLIRLADTTRRIVDLVENGRIERRIAEQRLQDALHEARIETAEFGREGPPAAGSTLPPLVRELMRGLGRIEVDGPLVKIDGMQDDLHPSMANLFRAAGFDVDGGDIPPHPTVVDGVFDVVPDGGERGPAHLYDLDLANRPRPEVVWRPGAVPTQVDPPDTSMLDPFADRPRVLDVRYSVDVHGVLRRGDDAVPDCVPATAAALNEHFGRQVMEVVHSQGRRGVSMEDFQRALPGTLSVRDHVEIRQAVQDAGPGAAAVVVDHYRGFGAGDGIVAHSYLLVNDNDAVHIIDRATDRHGPFEPPDPDGLHATYAVAFRADPRFDAVVAVPIDTAHPAPGRPDPDLRVGAPKEPDAPRRSWSASSLRQAQREAVATWLERDAEHRPSPHYLAAHDYLAPLDPARWDRHNRSTLAQAVDADRDVTAETVRTTIGGANRQEEKRLRGRFRNVMAHRAELLRTVLAADRLWDGIDDGLGRPPVQILSYSDPVPQARRGQERLDPMGVVVAIGDVRQAAQVAWLVPHSETTLPDALVEARNLYQQTALRSKDRPVATVLFYEFDATGATPSRSNPDFADSAGSRIGAAIRTFVGVRAAAGARPAVHLIGPGQFVGAAAGAGQLAKELATVTVVGSGGTSHIDHAVGFGVGTDRVFVASSSRDAETWSGHRPAWYRNELAGADFVDQPRVDPANQAFGARRVAAEFPKGFRPNDYFAVREFEGRRVPAESLVNFARIASGDTDVVVGEDHRTTGDARADPARAVELDEWRAGAHLKDVDAPGFHLDGRVLELAPDEILAEIVADVHTDPDPAVPGLVPDGDGAASAQDLRPAVDAIGKAVHGMPRPSGSRFVASDVRHAARWLVSQTEGPIQLRPSREFAAAWERLAHGEVTAEDLAVLDRELRAAEYQRRHPTLDYARAWTGAARGSDHAWRETPNQPVKSLGELVGSIFGPLDPSPDPEAAVRRLYQDGDPNRLLPDGTTAQAVRHTRWWAELSSADKDAVRNAHPTVIGRVVGLPAEIRHAANDSVAVRDGAAIANRTGMNLVTKVSDRARLANLEHVTFGIRNVARPEAETGPAPALHLLDFDAGTGTVLVAVGDVDSAHTVTWHVPRSSDDVRAIGHLLVSALDLQTETMRRGGSGVAQIVWAQHDPKAPAADFHRLAGDRLRADIAAFAAVRKERSTFADGPPPPTIRLLGVGNGTTTIAYAGRDGQLAEMIDTVTLLGSPGMGPVTHAAQFGIGTDRVFVGGSSADSSTYPRRGSGPDPLSEAFAARRIQAEVPDTGQFGKRELQRSYLGVVVEPGRKDLGTLFQADRRIPTEALVNAARVAAGHLDAVTIDDYRAADARVGADPARARIPGLHDRWRAGLHQVDPSAALIEGPGGGLPRTPEEILAQVRGPSIPDEQPAQDWWPRSMERGDVDVFEPLDRLVAQARQLGVEDATALQAHRPDLARTGDHGVDAFGNGAAVPADLRDKANRAGLTTELRAAHWTHGNDPEPSRLKDAYHAVAGIDRDGPRLRRAQAVLAALSGARELAERVSPDVPQPPVQLLNFAPKYNDGGRIVVAFGDVDAAESVTWLVRAADPDPDRLTPEFEAARNVYEQAALRSPDKPVAVISWMGRVNADVSGRMLAHEVAAFTAARSVDGRGAVANHLVGVGEGATVVGFAVAGGFLAADLASVTLLGAPGAGPLERAAEIGIGVDRVFVGSASTDQATYRVRHGTDPANEAFGAQRIQAEFPTDWKHPQRSYLRVQAGIPAESLINVGRIAAGHAELVPIDIPRPAGFDATSERAAKRQDPAYARVRDLGRHWRARTHQTDPALHRPRFVEEDFAPPPEFTAPVESTEPWPTGDTPDRPFRPPS